MSRLAERTLADRAKRALDAVARTLVVGSGGFATISEAVAAARDGDTVLVRPGRYRESVTVEGKTITVRGDGDREAIVVEGVERPAFHLVETCTTLDNLTVTGGGDHEQDGSLSTHEGSIVVAGGNPHLDRLRIADGGGVVFTLFAKGALTRSIVDHSQIKVRVASPRIEGNEILGWGPAAFGLDIYGDFSDPLVRANTIHDGHSEGIWVEYFASPRIEENEIWGTAGGGLAIGDRGNGLVRANRIHHGQGSGISVSEGACPRIEENEIWGNAEKGLRIDGTGSNPVVRANRIHDGHSHGIFVCEGACPTIEENEIWGNAGNGLEIEGDGTSPAITENMVRDGLANGISVSDGASPSIAGNRIRGNALEALHVADDANPTVGSNTLGP